MVELNDSYKLINEYPEIGMKRYKTDGPNESNKFNLEAKEFIPTYSIISNDFLVNDLNSMNSLISPLHLQNRLKENFDCH